MVTVATSTGQQEAGHCNKKISKFATMITSVTLLVLSLFALYIGAGWLVKGSTEIALKAKISNLVIGLTIRCIRYQCPGIGGQPECVLIRAG